MNAVKKRLTYLKNQFGLLNQKQTKIVLRFINTLFTTIMVYENNIFGFNLEIVISSILNQLSKHEHRGRFYKN